MRVSDPGKKFQVFNIPELKVKGQGNRDILQHQLMIRADRFTPAVAENRQALNHVADTPSVRIPQGHLQ